MAITTSTKFFIRFFDIFFSFTGVLFLSPLFIVVILILRFSGEGEIFYFQDRIGIEKKIFRIIKFATMLKESPNIGAGTITLKNDSRVLPFGKILRMTKINELPQLFNVLKGDMSLIGYRPLVEKDLEGYNNYELKIILSSPPGLSGLSSLFFSDENKFFTTKDPRKIYREVIAPIKKEIDLWYSNNITVKNYIKLIILTIFIVITKKKYVLKHAYPFIQKFNNYF